MSEKKTEIKPGVYEHYKGNLYEVIGVGRQSETLEEMVLYRALYTSSKFGENSLWVRPLSMFRESVEVNGVKIPRFMYIKGGSES